MLSRRFGKAAKKRRKPSAGRVMFRGSAPTNTRTKPASDSLINNHVITWPKINWDDVITKLVTWMIIGLLFISLQLITTQSIDGYQELKEANAAQQEQIDELLKYHRDHDPVEDEEPGFTTKLWRTVTFYEFRK
jgi:hypothetical protein